MMMVNHQLITLVVVGVTLTANYPNSNSNEVEEVSSISQKSILSLFFDDNQTKVNKYYFFFDIKQLISISYPLGNI